MGCFSYMKCPGKLIIYLLFNFEMGYTDQIGIELPM